MSTVTVGVIVPSNRPEHLKAWEAAWLPLLAPHPTYTPRYYPVHDEPATWDVIRDTLKDDAWIIPVQTDCIRSYGYLQAYRDGCDVLMTFDDDCMPLPGQNPIAEHLQWLRTTVEPEHWVRTLTELPTRGLPLTRPIVLNHGLWMGVPDVSASRQLEGNLGDWWHPWGRDNQIIPRGKFFPMCGMNLAWVRALTPWMYFGLQGSRIDAPGTPWGLHRSGDILCGVVMKAALDGGVLLPGVVRSGTPYVDHQRASDPHVNLERERSSEWVPWTWSAELLGVPAERLLEALGGLQQPSKAYCQTYARALQAWQRVLQV